MSCPKVLLSQELFAPALILVGKTSVSSSDCVKNQMSGDAWGKKKKDLMTCLIAAIWLQTIPLASGRQDPVDH